MDSILEKIISEINTKTSNYQEQIKEYIYILKGSSEKVVDSGKIRLEIKKIEFELNRMYKKLGKYTSDKYFVNDIVDFSYDDSFIEKLDEIKKINIYLNTLKKTLK